MVKPVYDHDKKLKSEFPEYDIDRVLNLVPGDLILYSGSNFRIQRSEKGFVIKKTQPRRPHRTDVYLVKLQGRDPKEIDERWLARLVDEEG
jgi:hypothetical protein